MTQISVEEAILEQIDLLARRRKPKRATQGDLAEAAGVSRESMNGYLRGKSPMPLPALIAICDYLGVSMHDLVKAAVLQSEQSNDAPGR